MKQKIFKLSILLMALAAAPAASAYDFTDGKLAYNIIRDANGLLVEVAEAYDLYKDYTSITVPATVSHDGYDYTVGRIGDYAFRGLKAERYEFPETIINFGANVFLYSLGIKEVEIPASVRFIGDGCFAFCENLEKVTLHEGLRSVGNSAFDFCGKLREITIPSTVTSIGASCFQSDNRLLKVTCLSTVPPNASDDTFSPAHYQNVELCVPETAIASYQTTTVWSSFAHIEKYDETTGVGAVSSAEGDAADAVYDMSGRRLTNPAHGVNILRAKNGKVRKVIGK